MPCKKLRTKARWEQDKWLSYGSTTYATEEERLEFLRFDSHGGKVPLDNPIYEGKCASAVADTAKGAANPKKGGGGWLPYADELKAIMLAPYKKWAWPGGLMIMEDYLRRVCGIAPLRKEFGDEIVQHWLAAFLFYAFGWPDLVMEERYVGTDIG
ncbi:hypothetical protein LCGC14_1855930 [marine sediment metagenome]|uniref:Uncharacterized protein n=1 Tax=marine sediment metagenome TaxID=412755 RepID=A0A0F9ING1_9ZZZZ